MGIQYVSSAQAFSDTLSVSTHQAGDFLFGIAINNTNGGPPPTVPAGWTLFNSGTGTYGSTSYFYKFAQSNSETFGTATNANQVAVMIYNGVDRETPIGNYNSLENPVSNNYLFDNLSFQITNGSSWMIGFGYAETVVSGFSVMSGCTNRLNSDRIILLDTNAGITGWNDDTASISGGFYSVKSANFELRAQSSANFFALM